MTPVTYRTLPRFPSRHPRRSKTMIMWDTIAKHIENGEVMLIGGASEQRIRGAFNTRKMKINIRVTENGHAIRRAR